MLSMTNTQQITYTQDAVDKGFGQQTNVRIASRRNPKGSVTRLRGGAGGEWAKNRNVAGTRRTRLTESRGRSHAYGLTSLPFSRSLRASTSSSS